MAERDPYADLPDNDTAVADDDPYAGLPDVEAPKSSNFGGQFATGVKSGASFVAASPTALKFLGQSTTLKQINDTLGAFDEIDQGKPLAKPRELGSTSMREMYGRVYADSPNQRKQLRDDFLKQQTTSKPFVQESLNAIRAFQEDQKAKTGRVPNLTDVKDRQDFVDWLGYNMGSGAATMAPVMLAAVLTGGAGAVAIGTGINTAEEVVNRVEAADSRNDPRNYRSADRAAEALERSNTETPQYVAETAGTTLAAGGAKGIVDVVGGPVGGAVRRRVGETAAEAVGKVLKGAPKTVARESGEEFLQEGGQEAISVGGELQLGENQATAGENAKRIFNAAAAGAAGSPIGSSVNVATDVIRARGIDAGEPPGAAPAGGTLADLERIETPEGPAFRTPSGAIVSESQWNDAPPDRQAMWMEPAGEVSADDPRGTIAPQLDEQAAGVAADVQLHRDEAARLEGEAERLRAAGNITQAETLRIRAISLAERADSIEAANGVSEQSPTATGIKVEEVEGARAPLEPTERMQELERLAGVTQDPVVKKDLLLKLKTERQAQEQATKNEATADSYDRIALETEDKALAAELKKKAAALRKPEKPTTRGIQVREEPVEEVEARAAGEVERRKDDATRKKIDEMSAEELRKELKTSPVTNLPNRRAYEEAPKRKVQTSVDVDSLKWVNDNMGHPAGDEMLRAVGEAVRESGAEGFHLSGDEFVIQSDTPEQAAAEMRKIRAILSKKVISHTQPDGTVYTKRGIGLSHGSGSSVNEAESKLRQNKSERARRGVRPERGAEPRGVVREAPRPRQEADGAGNGQLGRVPEGDGKGVSEKQAPEINTTPLWIKRSGLTIDDGPSAAKIRSALAKDQAAVTRAVEQNPDNEAAFMRAVQEILDASPQEKPSADAGGRRADDVAAPGAEVRRADAGKRQPDRQEARPESQEAARDVQQDGQPGEPGADLASRSRRQQPRAERDQATGDLAKVQRDPAQAAIAQNDSLFQIKKSEATTVAGIAKDVNPRIRVREVTKIGDERMHSLTMPDGTVAYIWERPQQEGAVYGYRKVGQTYEPISQRPGTDAQALPNRNGDVWIDVSKLKPGKGGAEVYAIAAGLAHNTGQVFIGDPSGITPAAIRRRSEQMLSSALKYGTTAHLAPHHDQLAGTYGVPPLKWEYGNDVANIESLLAVNLGALDIAFPQSQSLVYEPSTGQFVDAKSGSIVTDERLAGRLADLRNGKSGDRGVAAVQGVGVTTLKRGAVLRALLRQSGGKVDGPDGLLARLAGVAGSPALRGVLYSKGPTWFSPLQRAIEGITTKQASPQQWLNTITALQSKGVKADEIEFSGVKDWLATREGKVSRDDVLAFLRENGVQVTETMLGESAGSLKAQHDYIYNMVEKELLDHDLSDRDVDNILADFAPRLERAQDEAAMREALASAGFNDVEGWIEGAREHAEGTPSATRHSSYVLPGGKNYRELLITLPVKGKGQRNIGREEAMMIADLRDDARLVWARYPDDNGDIVVERMFSSKEFDGLTTSATFSEENRNEIPPGWKVYDEALDDQAAGYGIDPSEIGTMWRVSGPGFHSGRQPSREAAMQLLRRQTKDSNGATFQSSHWEQPNIVAHVRFNERTDADGKRVLFVEEIQSDWAQRGRKDGFKKTPEELANARRIDEENQAKFVQAMQDELREVRAELRAMPAGNFDSLTVEQQNRAVDLREKEAGLLDKLSLPPPSPLADLGIPRAPFVQKTEAWTALALKRVIRYAAENGFDRVAWVNGEQSAARYDLSKRISKIEYNPSSKTLRAYDMRGDQVITKHAEPSDLADIIGKEAAEKLLASPIKPRPGADPGNDIHTLQGEGLKIGGEGMKAFYDKIVPNVAKDVLKKLGGGTIESFSLQTTDKNPFSMRIASDGVEYWVAGEDPNGNIGNQRALTPKFKTYEEADKARTALKFGKKEQSGFDITPAMRELAMQGMPLFSRRQPRLGMGEQLASVRAALDDAFGKPLIDALIKAGILRLEYSWQNKRALARDPSVRAINSEGDERGPGASLFLDRIRAADAPALLMHEVGEHYGLPRMLGQDGYQKIIDGVRRAYMKKDAETVAAWELVKRDYTNDDGTMIVTEGSDNFIREVAAAMVEKGADRGWIREMLDAIRSWLARTFGVDVDKVDGNLLRGLATSALRQSAAGMLPRTVFYAEDRAGSAAIDPTTKAFKRWFGKSKVVDENGDPLVVWHGTQETAVDAFKTPAYFSNSRSFADQWARASNGTHAGGVMYPVHLRIENPYIIDGEQQGRHFDWDRKEVAGFKKSGFDGVIVRHSDGDIYTVFDPEQIKSAIGNRGTYDPNDPSILASRSMSLEADRISPRAPTAVSRTENPLTQELQPDLQTMMRDPEVFEHNLALLTGLDDIRVDPRATPEQQAEQVIAHFESNILALHDQMRPDDRERSKEWYVGGNRIAHRLGERFGVAPRQVAAVIAALSPQRDWFTNVSLAERFLSAVYEHPDSAWTPAMDKVLADRDWGKGLSQGDRARIRGKTLREVWGTGSAQELLSAAHWIRAWDEATNPNMYRVITPEGDFMSQWDTSSKGPMPIRAGSFVFYVKALKLMANDSRENISNLIGADHKVRSFYNNIIAPHSRTGDVTIDTHAMAAAHWLPMGSSDDVVKQGFGGGNPGRPASKSSIVTGISGNYAFYAEAYRRAAAARGILPREMQSITWEAVRGLFRPEQKKSLKDSAATIWARYGNGAIDENQARQETLRVAGGVARPKWAEPVAGNSQATEASTYAAQLPEAGAPGGGAVPDSVGDAGRGAGGTEDLASRSPNTPAFKAWFGDSKVVDADGKPMPVYHGTDADFKAFDTTDFGSWFAERPATTDKYSDRGARSEGDRQVSGPMVYPVYLRIKKPFEIPSDIDLSDDTFTVAEALKELNAQNGTSITPADIGFPGDYRGNHFESLVMPEMIDVLKGLGYDGIHAYEQGESTWNAFSPKQIKSTFNSGAFDPNDPNTLAAKSRALPQPPTNSSQLDAETNAQMLQRKFFDRFNRVRQLQRERRPGIVDDKNVVQADTLYYGRAQYEGEELERKFIEPLGEALKDAKKIGLTVRDADDYLMAKHAPERNRVIAARNPNMPDGGSGLTNRQAAAILAGFDPAKTAALDRIAQIVYRMNEDRLLRSETSGLISPQFAQQLRQQYQNYVPLKTLEEESAVMGMGRGYELRNSGIEMAFGRQSKAGSPIASSIMDAARAVIMAEKAKVDQVIWNLANDPDVVDVMTPVDDSNAAQHFSRQRLNPTTGQIETIADPNWRSREDVVKLRIAGDEKYVWVRDDILRDQLRKVASLADPGPVLRGLGRVTSTIGRLLTEFNPAFTLPNAVRDAIGGVIKSNGIERVSPARVLAGIPAAWKSIIDFKRDANTPGGQMYRDFQQDGAKTGAYGITDVADTMHRLERLGGELGYPGKERGITTKLMHGLNDLAKFVGHANEVVEYATRLSLYKEARRVGYSRKQAAVWAKELTVNFNRSGEYGRTMNSIFVFANAALQGLYGAIMFGKSNKVRAALLGMVVLGAITQAFNEGFGGDDEDTGEKNVNTISDHTLDNNATVLMPGSANGIKIPLPPEFSFLYAMGRRAYRAMTQGNYGKEAAGILGAILGSTLPLRAPDASSTPLSVMKALTPTAVSPFMDIAVNEDFRGAPIVPNQRDKDAPQPWPVLARSQTSDVSKAVADFVNTATGGDMIEPGAAQKALGPFVSPEAMDHVVGFYTGGLGQFALQSKNLARAVGGDEKAVEVNRVPIANRFVFTQPIGYVGRRYRELAPDFQYAIARQRDGSSEKINDKVMAALPVYRGAERQLAPLFKQLRAAGEENDTARIEDLRSQIRAVQSTVVKAYNEARP